MPLDESTRRLAFLIQRDLRRLTERERTRGDRGEMVRYDSVSRMATWETKRGDVIGRWYGEVIASFVIRDRILRWAWAGRASLATATHAEVIFREGQSRSVPQLAMSVIGDIDEADATMLARLGVLVSRGEGLEFRRNEAEITFIGLFDSPRPREGDSADPSRYSVPPPPVAAARESQPPQQQQQQQPPQKPESNRPPRDSSPPAAPYRSLPPIREIYGPRNTVTRSAPPQASAHGHDSRAEPSASDDPSHPNHPSRHPTHRSQPPVHHPAASASQAPPAPAPLPPASPSRPPQEPPPSAPRKIREPAKSVFLPAATAVLAELTKATPSFKQALFVLTVDTETSGSTVKRRLIVVLVAVDGMGVLRQIDPSHELVEIAARMVEADRVDGNGPWRKLSARITPKPDGGATLNVDVL